MKKLLEILPDREVSYEMQKDVFTIFYDLVRKTIANNVPMTFRNIYNTLPQDLQARITVTETLRTVNDIREFELISIQREEIIDESIH